MAPKRLQQFWNSADLALIHHRRERRMRVLASFVMWVLGGIWAVFFSLQGHWLIVAIDLALMGTGVAVFTLSWLHYDRSARRRHPALHAPVPATAGRGGNDGVS
ncbi:MAG: hypothetical protein AAGC84_06025 [Pseudomonas sp.]